MERYYSRGSSIEERIEGLFGRVCFYSKDKIRTSRGENKKSSYKSENFLLPEDIKTKKQAGKFIAQRVAFIELSRPEFAKHPLIYRPYPEW